MFLRYIGSKYPGGIGDDHEHVKFYWGPENDWICEVPDKFGAMILQTKGIENFEVIPKPNVTDVKLIEKPAAKPIEVVVPQPPDKPEPKPKKKLGRK